MLTIDLRSPIREINGSPALKQGGEPLLLKEVCIESLLAVREGEVTPAMEKVRRAKLAYRIYDADSLEFTAEDAAYIKEQIGKDWGPLAVYQAWELIDKGSTND